MGFLEQLDKASKLPIVYYHRFIASYKSNANDIYVFCEGDVDLSYYAEQIERIIPKIKIHKFPVECKSKLYISVISPFWGDDQNRYSEISNAIVTFLVNDLKLCIDEAIAIKQRLLEYWQFRFQHNSSQPDKNEMKKISKKEFAWPIAVYLTKEGVPDISECLSFTPDQSITEEVRRLMLDPLMIYHERFEFSNRVIQDYIAFRKTQSNGIKEIEMHFIKEHGNDYCDEFRTGDDTEIIEYVTKAFIYKILINHRNMAKIQAGIGVKS